jgi:hypothetical protein
MDFTSYSWTDYITDDLNDWLQNIYSPTHLEANKMPDWLSD